jgi:hypothetical protein
MNHKAGITAVLAATLLFGLYATSILAKPPTATRTKTIKVKIDDPTDPAKVKLEITSRGTDHGCPSSQNPGRGCIKVDRGEAADLVFDLKGNPKCSNTEYWMLTAVQLGGYNSNTKPAANGWGNLPADVVADFRANPANGEAQVTLLDKDRMRVHNMNQQPYDIWYRLKAECTGANPIYSDPIIKNTGK